MLIDIQDSAYKDLKKIDKKEAIRILATWEHLGKMRQRILN